MSNIHGFGSSKKSDPDSDSEGGGKPPGKGLPPRQDYVGSGLNVQQPKKMVRIALKFPPTSAIPAHPHPHATCTLQVDDVMKLQGGPAGTKGEFKMEYWKNGIRMGDSTTLIPFDSPDGKEIMAAVASQRVPIKFMPPELQQKAAAGDVFVEMSDHREEGDYKAPPPPAYVAFSGGGHAAGVAAPSAATAIVQDGAGVPPLSLTPGEPATVIQVRLVDGKRLVVNLHLSHTVHDLQRVVAGAHATGGKPFLLKGGFPPKSLDNPSLTIAASGLANSAVTQALA